MIAGLKAAGAAFALVCAASAAEKAAGPQTIVGETQSPAGPDSFEPRLSRGRDGAVWLAWMEEGQGGCQLRASVLDPGGTGWSRSAATAPISAAKGEAAHEFAFAAADRTRLAAAWIGEKGGGWRLLIRTSSDGGALWTQPEALSAGGRIARAPALTALADGSFLAAWLESPPGSGPADGSELHARLVGPGAVATDQLVDRRTSGGSGPSLVPFLDGGAGVAYRGLDGKSVRDIFLSRLRHGNWTPGRAVNNDHWDPGSPPVSRPALAADGGRLLSAWFTGADNNPRLLASSSPDAGERFLIPLTVETGPIAGQPATLLLHDNAALVFWISHSSKPENNGLWMRRISPDFTLDPPFLVRTAFSGETPAAAIAQDYAGGSAPARVVIAFAASLGGVSTVHTLELIIPEPAWLAMADDACHCTPTPEQMVGYAIRGTILKVDPGAATVTVEHDEIPGILDAGTDGFQAARDLVSSLKPGYRCLARIERRNGEWTIFDVRLLLGRQQ